jgi:hypothetical protein
MSSKPGKKDESDEPSDPDLTPLQKKILATKHPLEMRANSSKRPSLPLQRAITFFLRESGGQATENEVLEFIQTNWGEIQGISVPPFQQDPGLRLLHVQLAVKRDGKYLFMRGPGDCIALNSQGIEVVRHFQPSSRSKQTDTAKVSDKEPLKPFDEKLMEFLCCNPPGLTTEDLLRYLSKYKEAPGPFCHLDLPRRIRACLLTKKQEKIITFLEDQKVWRVVRWN